MVAFHTTVFCTREESIGKVCASEPVLSIEKRVLTSQIGTLFGCGDGPLGPRGPKGPKGFC